MKKFFFLIPATILISCSGDVKVSNSTDNSNTTTSDQQTSGTVSSETEFMTFYNSLPELGNKIHMDLENNPPKNEKTYKWEWVQKMKNDRTKTIEEGGEGTSPNIKLLNNEYGEYKIKLMLTHKLNFNSTYKIALGRYADPDNTFREWHIFSFDENGEQISAVDRCSDFYIMNEKIVTEWYFASDPEPTYQTWILQKDGIFNMTETTTEMPEEFRTAFK